MPDMIFICMIAIMIFISLNYINHLHDIPMAKTYINSYAPTREVICRTIQKIAGQSAFDENVFCGRWDSG